MSSMRSTNQAHLLSKVAIPLEVSHFSFFPAVLHKSYAPSGLLTKTTNLH